MRIGSHVRVCRTRMLHSMSMPQAIFASALHVVPWVGNTAAVTGTATAPSGLYLRGRTVGTCANNQNRSHAVPLSQSLPASDATSRLAGILTTAGLTAPCAALCCAAKQSRWTDRPRETNPSCANTRAPPNSPDTVVNQTVLLPHEAELSCASARHVMCHCGTAVGSYRPTGSAEYSAERCELTLIE